MNLFMASLWAETLKARRSKVTLLTALGISLLPLVGGLFMIILKDPERAQSLGLIGTKAQLAGGVADWPTLFLMLRQGSAIGGGVLFALITAWVFGREFSDHTAKELLALPTPREYIVGTKFVLLAGWILLLTLWVFLLGVGIGLLVDIPGWSLLLLRTTFGGLLVIALLNFMLMPFVALIASLGRGYLPPMGWTFLTIALAQIMVVLGWGDWFPWSVPALYSGMAGPAAGLPGVASLGMIAAAFLVGIVATFIWWRQADQAR